MEIGVNISLTERIRVGKMANHKIKMIQQDEKIEGARVMEVTLGQKKFQTPFKSMNLPQSGHLLEVYQSANDKLIRDSRDSQTVLNKLATKCRKDTINLIITMYTDTAITDATLCDLENRIHPHTDVIVVPRWDGTLKIKTGSNLSDDLWSLSKRYIDEVRCMNGKLIIGNLPMNRPQSVIDTLVDRYFAEGITSFVLDYEACNAPGKKHIVRGIAKKLIAGGFFEESLLYSINMRKTHDYGDINPADDLLSFTDGIDILGNYHMRGGGGKDHIAKIFNPSDWAYNSEEVGKKNHGDINSMNQISINKEAEIIKREILENGSVMKLARTKRGAQEYIQTYVQSTLDFGGLGWG